MYWYQRFDQPVIIDVAVKDQGGHIVPGNVLTQLQDNELRLSPVDLIIIITVLISVTEFIHAQLNLQQDTS